MNIKKILLVILLVILIAAAANYKKINNLYTVVTLFDENKIVYNFSHLHESMFSTELMSGVASVAFPEDKKQIVKKYIWKNKTKSIEDYLTATNSTSLLVLHDGKLVHEDYRLGTTQTDTRISWSMAKSFLSALFGIAVENGQIDITKTVTDYVPELADSAYNQVPIVAVLNMASGVEFNEDYLDFNSDINKMGRALGLGSSMDEFAGTLKTQERKPGTNRHYVSIDTHVLGMILRNATGKSIKELFETQLWSKLSPEGKAYFLTDGFGNAFVLGGLNLTTRDYAKFGELFRNQGVWKGEQVIPANWVSESTANNAPPPPDTKIDTFGYGYQWWIPQDANQEFFAGGIYGQFIYINPKLKTVIVKTSAHREFQDDGNGGREVKLETIEMFRAIANSL